MANGQGLIHFPSLSRMALGLANLGERQRGNVLPERSLEQRERAAYILSGGQGNQAYVRRPTRAGRAGKESAPVSVISDIAKELCFPLSSGKFRMI